MSEEKIETRLTVDPSKVMTAKFIEPKYSQPCLLCNNTRELPYNPMHSIYPWICDECKEAIAFLKDFIKQATVAKDMLAEMEEPHENIHPL